ncbi:MAG: GDP-mannose 4,6-dehydratase [Patescibacteria group bacterium]|nr:GDP-mannose 4,6-dehydratase [Patescibacteria group bacterium]MCL5431681.1 GDP-mannose 4,6-dehydratase [Patescibacteria group bacterium]
MKQKILVTGGAGFIGSNTVRLLCDHNFSVTVLDNLSYGHKGFVDARARFVLGDIRNPRDVSRAMKGADAVFHFAAESIIKYSLQQPKRFFETNVMGLINVLETMKKLGVKHIVNSSSAAVYGEPALVPISEEAPKNPLQPYGASKLAAEAALSAYFHSFCINSTSLRYFNAYGPNDEQQPVTRAVPLWIKSIINNDPIRLYWGGNQLRDYVFVEDIALAHLAVVDLAGCNQFNIGTGKGILMKDILTTISRIIGKKTKIIDGGIRPGDPNRLVANITKITDVVGWKPKIGLKEGLEATVDYYKSQLNVSVKVNSK